MRKLCLLLGGLVLCGVSGAADKTGPPEIDKAKLAEYIRYAEGFLPDVTIKIGDPGKTASPELWSIPVHVATGNQSDDLTYYMTSDGQELTGGKLWYMSESPFADILRQLPSNGPSFGPPDAKITVVVFSDFECPFCHQLAQTIRQNIPKDYPTQVRVLYIDFPLQKIHPWALSMAEAARCVWDGDNERFWALHDWIFAHQSDFTTDNIKQTVMDYAKEHNLDTAKIGACIESHASKPAIEQNIEAGARLHLNQTPVVFVNGRMLGGAQSWATLDAVIKLDLRREQELSETSPGKTP